MSEVPLLGQPIRCDFYRHVLLPPKYVPREALLREVRDVVLKASSPIALTSALQSGATAFHGMGGIGKTVMARALCDDAEVQSAFPDGILWASLGKDATEADIIKQMGEWVTALGETVAASAPSLNTLKERLSRLLEARACLCIVDDVWQYSLADHFRIGGPHCRLLITTRDTEVAHALDARPQPIPLMTEAEAVALLEAWADGAVTEGQGDLPQQIIHRLGRLPLAIRLAGAQLRRQPPEAWVRRFSVRTLQARRPETIHDSLEQTFKLSLEDVEAGVQRLYAALVIFREDEPIPEAGIARLWEGMARLDREQTSMTIDDLASRALLQINAGSPRTIVLHDLLRDLMGAELAGDVAVVHAALLQAYATTQQEQGWHTTPDDGYLYTHLAYHLLAAGRKDELCTLLIASLSWMEVKFHVLGGDMSYAADVDAALTACQEAATATELLQLAQLVAARQVVQQRVRMYTDNDLAILVLIRLDAQALSHARLRTDLREKFTGLMMIHTVQRERGRSEGRLLDEALEIARAIEAANARTEALRTVATALAHAGQSAPALETVLTIADAEARTETLRTVAAALAQAGREEEASKVLSEALEAARAIEPAYRRTEALRTVAAALAHAGREEEASRVLSEALEAARAIEDADTRTEALHTVAIALAEAGQSAPTLEAAQAIEPAYRRTETLHTVAAALAHAGREEEASRVLSEALEVARAIEDADTRTEALCTVATALAEAGQSGPALEAARAIEDADTRTETLCTVATALAEAGQSGPALEAARAIEDADTRTETLRTVATALAHAGQSGPALEAARAIEDADIRTETLRTVATALAQAGQSGPALEAARAIEDADICTEALCTVAAALTQAGREEEANRVLSEALEAARAIKHAYRRTEALRTVATALAQAGQSTSALEAARAIEDADICTEALCTVAVALAQAGQSAPALEAARAIEDADICTEALCTVAAALTQAGREEEASRVLSEALEAARAIEATEARTEALRTVATALAQAGRFWEAFFTLLPLDPYNYLEAIAQWLPLLEKFETGFSGAVISEVVRIVGWV